MTHDSRCATASTDVSSCDCECEGRLHGIGDGNDDHQTAQITEREQRIEREFDKHFEPGDLQQLKQNANIEAWEQLQEEEPELAEMLQKAEDDPDLDFEVDDVYWQKNAGGDRMQLVAPGIDDAENIDEDRREKLRDAAYEYMERMKAKEYEKRENRLRELDRTIHDRDEFPELDHIRSGIRSADVDPYEDQESLYNAEHRFGDLRVHRSYKKSEDGEKLLVYTTYRDEHGEVVDETQRSHDMDEIDVLPQFVKANHNGDPQEEFRKFGE